MPIVFSSLLRFLSLYFQSKSHWRLQLLITAPPRLEKSFSGKFVAGTFDPKERVRLGDRTEITSRNASRLSITLIKASGFNGLLRKWRIPSSVTVQKIQGAE